MRLVNKSAGICIAIKQAAVKAEIHLTIVESLRIAQALQDAGIVMLDTEFPD